jgi:predicted DsbA family dithiol-disulfide isomerase
MTVNRHGPGRPRKRPLEPVPEVSSRPCVRPRLLEPEVSIHPQELHPVQWREVQEEDEQRQQDGEEQRQRGDEKQRRLQPYVEDDDNEYGGDNDVAIFRQIAEGLIAHDLSRSFLNNFLCG